jgi:Fe-S-cluster containining protein
MNGGPALHVEDEKLYQENVFGRESLITVRKGEPVRSPENYRLTWCENEIIKLKGKAGQWTCSFYTEKTGSCSIYNRRPLECELLKCWDTEELQSVKLLAELNELVNKDLDLRSEAIKKYNLNVDLEVFYFGRPVFKILSQFDLLPREINNKVILIQT